MKFIIIFFSALLAATSASSQTLNPFVVNHGATDSPLYRPAIQVLGGELYYLDTFRANQGIQVYDWSSGELKRIIPLNRAGVGIRSFKVLSPDSIMVFSDYYKKSFSLINGQGKPLGLFNMIGDHEVHPSLANWLSYRGSAIAVMNKKLLLAKKVLRVEALESSAGIVSVDLEAKKSWVMPPLTEAQIPTLSDSVMKYLAPNITSLPEDRVLVSYPFLDEVQVYTGDPQGASKVDLSGNDLLPQLKNAPVSQPKGESVLSKIYLNILYNESRKEIYRLVRVPIDKAAYREFKASKKKSPIPHYAVLRFNLDFEATGVTLMAIDTYHAEFGLVIVGEDLWCLRSLSSSGGNLVFEKLQF